MRQEFEVHKLNNAGLLAAGKMADAFDVCLNVVEGIIAGNEETVPDSRYLSLVRTKLEEASFFAKKAIAIQADYQTREHGN